MLWDKTLGSNQCCQIVVTSDGVSPHGVFKYLQMQTSSQVMKSSTCSSLFLFEIHVIHVLKIEVKIQLILLHDFPHVSICTDIFVDSSCV